MNREEFVVIVSPVPSFAIANLVQEKLRQKYDYKIRFFPNCGAGKYVLQSPEEAALVIKAGAVSAIADIVPGSMVEFTERIV